MSTFIKSSIIFIYYSLRYGRNSPEALAAARSVWAISHSMSIPDLKAGDRVECIDAIYPIKSGIIYTVKTQRGLYVELNEITSDIFYYMHFKKVG